MKLCEWLHEDVEVDWDEIYITVCTEDFGGSIYIWKDGSTTVLGSAEHPNWKDDGWNDATFLCAIDGDYSDSDWGAVYAYDEDDEFMGVVCRDYAHAKEEGKGIPLYDGNGYYIGHYLLSEISEDRTSYLRKMVEECGYPVEWRDDLLDMEVDEE